MNIRRIGLIGHLAIGQEKYDGQTVSTRMWQTELKKMHLEKSPIYVDTFNYKHRAISLIANWLKCMISCCHIVFMLSGNGMRVFLPLLYYTNKLFKRKLYHRVIGGNLCEYVKKYPKWVKYLNGFEVNWVQSTKMVEELKRIGVKNGEYLENFRAIKAIAPSELTAWREEPYKFCTFCRVCKPKGIGLAINAISEVNKKYNRMVAELHIYGPVEDAYTKEFNHLLHSNSDCIYYEGAVESSEAVAYLKKYYFHLFPTTWDGEGFPGTLIDCYNAGLPTIASDWAYNSEFIRDGEMGYIYDWKQPELLTELILKTISLDEHIYLQLRKNNLDEASKYTSEVVMEKVRKRMEQ